MPRTRSLCFSPTTTAPCLARMIGGAVASLWNILTALLVAFVTAMISPDPAWAAASRIKDITTFEGIRDNMLIGYGLVVGLQGTGDNIDSMAFTKESLISMLDRLGINTRDSSVKSTNIAAVMVTAELPAFARQGSRINVSVSALGDAKSLLGGTLLVTPLVGADGEVYSVAQGPVQIGGFSASGAAASVSKGIPTTGRIPNGAIVEREIAFDLHSLQTIHIALRNPDLTTTQRISSSINAFLGAAVALPLDPGTVRLTIPSGYDPVTILTEIEQLRIEPDQLARVVIDEQTGTIVIGDNVRVSRIAIAQGGLTIRVTETPQVSQPTPFSETGTTVVVPRTDIQVDEGKDNKLAIVDSGVNLQELVNGLNALGIGPRDMISILQTIKVSGALQADIEVM